MTDRAKTGEEKKGFATMSLPVSKMPNVYTSNQCNIDMGIDKRLAEKQRPTAMTGEDFDRFGQMMSALCGWNNGCEKRAPFRKKVDRGRL